MSRLSDQIQKLIDPFPGSFSELARSAGIDRSTLYRREQGGPDCNELGTAV